MTAGRPGWRPKAEDLPSIDVRRWERQDLLDGPSFTWTWAVNGPTRPTLDVAVTKDWVDLCLIINGRSRRDRVWLTWTPCHFGGKRLWFQCPTPSCHRRAAKLYMGARVFACRRCYNLAYQSQCYGRDDRYVAQAAKIRRALGGPEGILDDFPDRPKGMHWRTYERLASRCAAYERPVFATIERLLAVLSEVEASGHG